jgi:RTX calcium-binding nonapeptide repeat (4 copies)
VANYFYNDRRTNAADGAVLGALATGDTITLGVDAVWAAINGTAIQTNGSGRLFVHGQVYGRVGIDVRALGASVVIGSTGIVSGVEAGINNSSGSVTLTNNGQIFGATGANLGASGNFINNGSISGDTYGVRLALTYTIEVVNTGTITATGFYGLSMTGNQPFSLTNSGTIASTSYAVYIAGVTDFGGRLINTGTIAGDVAASSALTTTVVNTGTITGAVILGAGDDLFDSSQGRQLGYVSGGSGADELRGSADANDLRGGSGDDEIRGADGNDIVIGGAGADILDGGAGQDLAGYRDASVGITASLADPTRNTLDALGDTYISIEGLSGSSHDDTLYGDTRANRLLGLLGNDLLDGAGGADTMRGGFGDDTYVVDHVGDRVIERSNEGQDLVRSAVSYVLADTVEDLVLTGPRAIAGTGNPLANVMTGNNAANVLSGRQGADVLTGGGDADIFVLDTAPDIDQIDTILDFTSREDRIRLDRAVFTELNGGSALATRAFATGAVAGDANDRILYHRASGMVFYDADGTGEIAEVQIVQLDPGTALVAADFQLVV